MGRGTSEFRKTECRNQNGCAEVIGLAEEATMSAELSWMPPVELL